MPRLKLVGRILTALAFVLMPYAITLPDGSGTSPRGLVALLGGILVAICTVLVMYGDGEDGSPLPP